MRPPLLSSASALLTCTALVVASVVAGAPAPTPPVSTQPVAAASVAARPAAVASPAVVNQPGCYGSTHVTCSSYSGNSTFQVDLPGTASNITYTLAGAGGGGGGAGGGGTHSTGGASAGGGSSLTGSLPGGLAGQTLLLRLGSAGHGRSPGSVPNAAYANLNFGGGTGGDGTSAGGSGGSGGAGSVLETPAGLLVVAGGGGGGGGGSDNNLGGIFNWSNSGGPGSDGNAGGDRTNSTQGANGGNGGGAEGGGGGGGGGGWWAGGGGGGGSSTSYGGGGGARGGNDNVFNGASKNRTGSNGGDGYGSVSFDRPQPGVNLSVAGGTAWTTPTFTVSVDATAGVTPTGQVDVYDQQLFGNGGLLCSATLFGGSGTCTSAVPVPGGTTTLTAAYEGDAAYADNQTTQNYLPTPAAVAVDVTATDNHDGTYTLAGSVTPASGLVNGTLHLSTDPSDPAVAAACPDVSAPAPDASRIGLPLTSSCTVRLLPGAVAVHASFTGGVDTASGNETQAAQLQVPKYPTSVHLAFAPSTLTEYGDTTTATVTVDPPTGTGTPHGIGGTVTVHPATGSSGSSCTVTLPTAATGNATQVTGSCTVTPSGLTQQYVATYSGDDTFADQTSDPQSVYTAQAVPTVTVQVQQGGAAVTSVTAGGAVTLAGRVQVNGQDLQRGTLTLYDGPVTSPTGTNVVASFALAAGTPLTTTITPGLLPSPAHVYFAQYTDDAGSSDYQTVTVSTATLTVVPLPATLAVTTTTVPVAAGKTAAAQTVVVTAKLGLPAADTAPVGTLSLSPTGATCGSVTTVTAADGSRRLTLVCRYAQPAGATLTATASYTDDLVGTVSRASTVVVPASATTVTVASTTAAYGATTTLAAVVTPQITGTPVPGSVAFAVDGTTVCTATVTAAGAASCAAPVLGVGAHRVTATFTSDTPGVAAGSATATAATLTVTALPVSLAVTASAVDATTLLITASATVDGGSTVTAGGSVDFGAAFTSCRSVALSGGSASCRTSLPAAGFDLPITVRYLATDPDFVAGAIATASTTYTRPTSGPCSAAFGALWQGVAGAAGGSFALDTHGLGTLTVTTPSGIGACDSAAVLASTASISLFGGTLQAGSVTFTADQTSGVCLTGGTVTLPAAFHTGTLTFAQSLCFPILADASLGLPVSGSFTAGANATLPLMAVPGVTGAASVTLSVARKGSGTTAVPTLTLAASVAAAGSVPAATITVSVARDGSIAGTAEVGPLSLFGAPVTLTGAVTRTGSSGALAVSLSGALTGAVSPVTGLLVSAGTVGLTGATGSSPTFTVSADATVGTGAVALPVSVTGSFTGTGSFSLGLTSTATSWTPAPGLTVSAALRGSLERSGGKTTYSLAAGDGTTPLATWAAPGGVTVGVDAVSLGGDPTTVDSGCPFPSGAVLALSGSMAVGGLSVAAAGCLSLGGGGWHVRATGSNATVGGLTLSSLVLDATRTGGVGASTAVTGSATARLTVGSLTASTTVTLQVSGGVLAVGGHLDATALGLPTSTAYVAYASAAVEGFQTGQTELGADGVVDLPAGVSVFGALPIPAAVTSALGQAHIAVPANGIVTFSASVSKGAKDITFTAALGLPSGFPLLTLPGGSTVTGAVVSWHAGAFGLVADGTVANEDGTAAPAHLDVTIATSGDLSGTATVDGLVVFGTSVDLAGSVERRGGKLSASVTGRLNGAVTVADVTVSGVAITLGTDGLSVAGTLTAAGAKVAVAGLLVSTTNWSLAVKGQVANWSPATGVTVDAALSGSLTRTAKGFTYDVSALPLTPGGTLLTLRPSDAVTMGLTAFRLSNTASLPSGCTVAAAGDTWLAVSGAVTVSFGSGSGQAQGSGCFDLTRPAFTLAVQVGGSGFSAAGGRVTLSALTLTVTRAGTGGYVVVATTRLFVQMPTGGTFSLSAQLVVNGGVFAIGGVADLSSYLGSSAARAYLYYANGAIVVPTGDPTLRALALTPGVTVGLDFAMSPSMAAALSRIGMQVGENASLAATANIDLTNPTIVLKVALSSAKATVFSTANGTTLTSDSLSLQMTLSPTQPSFGLVTAGTLHVPSTVPGGSPSDIGLTGSISIGTQLTFSLTVSNWNDAFGLRGLVLDRLTLQGGITLTGLPLPSLAIAATVSGLPGGLASVLGYQQGAPMTLALALGQTSLLVDISVGTKNSGTAALKPFSLFGAPDLLHVDFAELYLSPTGATIGQTVYAPGYSLAFQGSVYGVSVDVDAKIDPTAGTFYFRGSVGTIHIGSLTLGPTTLSIDAGPSKFDMAFSGHLQLGPGEVSLGPLLKIGGGLSTDVTVAVGTSGISASLNLAASLYFEAYQATDWCKSSGIWLPCNYQWVKTSPIGFSVSNLSFAINSSGLTLGIPNTSSTITFPWPSSPFSARAVSLTGAPAEQTLDLHGLQVAAPAAVTTPQPVPLATGAVASSPTAVGDWRTAGAMGQARTEAASVTLADGRVLVAGGASSSGSALASAEVFDPSTGGWSATAPMGVARIDAAAVRLADGRVLVVGGDTGSAPTASAEIFDPASGRWSAAGAVHVARQAATATLLPDGSVLVAGGHDNGTPSAAVDRFTPATGTWQQASPLGVARGAATATALPDGRVLVAGGMGTSGPLASAEVWSDGRWTATGSMGQARFLGSASLLPGGRVLVTGTAATVEVWDPATGAWTQTGALSTPTTLAATYTLADGRVVVAGGTTGQGTGRQVDVFDPATQVWQAAAPLPAGRFGAATATTRGTAVLAGGTADGQPTGTTFVLAAAGTAVPAAAFHPASAAPVAARSSSGWGIGSWTAVALAVLGLLVLVSAGFVLRRRRA